MNLINFKIIPGPELVEEPARLVSSLICVEWVKKFVKINLCLQNWNLTKIVVILVHHYVKVL